MATTDRRYSIAIGVAALLVLAAVLFAAFSAAAGDGEAPADEEPTAMATSGGRGSTAIETLPPSELPAVTPTPSPSPTEAPTEEATPNATEESPTTTPEPIEEPPTPTPEPVDTPTPTVEATAPPDPSAAAPPGLSGRWRIVDTVTDGAGAGQIFTFDVVLTQSGSSFSGGNFELSLSGVIAGDSITAQFAHPSGITGSFAWTLGADGTASGAFESSAPNSGTSQLIRLP